MEEDSSADVKPDIKYFFLGEKPNGKDLVTDAKTEPSSLNCNEMLFAPKVEITATTSEFFDLEQDNKHVDSEVEEKPCIVALRAAVEANSGRLDERNNMELESSILKGSIADRNPSTNLGEQREEDMRDCQLIASQSFAFDHRNDENKTKKEDWCGIPRLSPNPEKNTHLLSPEDGVNIQQSITQDGIGLRNRLPPKPKKDTRLPNAEKCHNYKERLKKEDPEKWEDYLKRNRAQAHQWRTSQTDSQKEYTREMARIRQQKRRERLKAETGKRAILVTLKKSTRKKSITTRQDDAKLAEKRKQDRERQAKRRANIKASPQKYRREKERRQKERIKKRILSANANQRCRVHTGSIARSLGSLVLFFIDTPEQIFIM